MSNKKRLPLRVTPIRGLFFTSRPSDIAGFVVTIIIDSFQCVKRCRFTANMVNKFPECRESKLDSAATVIVPLWRFWISAAFFGSMKRAVFTAAFSFRPFSVNTEPDFRKIKHQATATSCMSISETVYSDDTDGTAVTQAMPQRVATVKPNDSDSEKAPESFSAKINNRWMGCYNFFVSHGMSRSNRDVRVARLDCRFVAGNQAEYILT